MTSSTVLAAATALLLCAAVVNAHTLTTYTDAANNCTNAAASYSAAPATCVATGSTSFKISAERSGSCFWLCSAPTNSIVCDACIPVSSTVSRKWVCNSTHTIRYDCTDSACGTCAPAVWYNTTSSCASASSTAGLSSAPAACNWAVYYLYGSDATCTTASSTVNAKCGECKGTYKITCAGASWSLTASVLMLAAVTALSTVF